jgi:hypothetical protein
MIRVPPSPLVATQEPVRHPTFMRRLAGAFSWPDANHRHRRLMQAGLAVMALVIVLAAAIPLKASLSRTAEGVRFDPPPAGLRSMATTRTHDASVQSTAPIVPADSSANAERGAGWGPLRLTDW